MAISPRTVGDTGPQFWMIQDSGGNALPITGATFTYLIYNSKTNIWKNGNGSFNVTNGAKGAVTYLTDPSDVAVTGNFLVSVQCVLTDGTKRITLPQPFQIVPIFVPQ